MAEWVTTKEASEMLGVSIRTIQRYVVGGKLKAKVVGGKSSVKKDAIIKLKPTGQETTNNIEGTVQDQKLKSPHHANWQIPDGYLLIDKSTLDSLREQIKILTDSVGEMQLTQKLLIEKGLNLKEDKLTENVITEPKIETKLPEPAVIDTPIENVAKAHEEFFGKKEKHNSMSLIWLALATIGIVIVLVIVANVLASGSL